MKIILITLLTMFCACDKQPVTILGHEFHAPENDYNADDYDNSFDEANMDD